MPLPSPLELSFLDEVLKLVPPLLGLSLRPLRLHPAAAERLREFCRLRQIEQRARRAAAAASRGAAGAVPWSAPLAGAWGGPSCQVRAGKEARKRAGLRAARIYIYIYIWAAITTRGALARSHGAGVAGLGPGGDLPASTGERPRPAAQTAQPDQMDFASPVWHSPWARVWARRGAITRK